MSRRRLDPTTTGAPVPAAMVTCADADGKANIITIAWTGTICSTPPMAYISVAKPRYSYSLIAERREFAINLPTKELAYETDFCGVNSGRDVDKFEALGLTAEEASAIGVPIIKECPVAIECRLKDIIELGSHDLFIADVVAVDADDAVIDESGKLRPGKAGLISFVNHEYWALGEKVGYSGYSRKQQRPKG